MDEFILCQKCGKRPIHVKKRQLCQKCYQREYHAGTLKGLPIEIGVQHRREMEFLESYFDNPDNYIYQPAIFRIKTGKYWPDFYDVDRGVFLEVVGSRQAYHLNKHKYNLFRHCFPSLVLELRAPCGELIDEKAANKNLKWPKSVNN